jgi:hypothetical protein
MVVHITISFASDRGGGHNNIANNLENTQWPSPGQFKTKNLQANACVLEYGCCRKSTGALLSHSLHILRSLLSKTHWLHVDATLRTLRRLEASCSVNGVLLSNKV